MVKFDSLVEWTAANRIEPIKLIVGPIYTLLNYKNDCAFRRFMHMSAINIWFWISATPVCLTFSVIGAKRRVGVVARQVVTRGALVRAQHDPARRQRYQCHAAAQR